MKYVGKLNIYCKAAGMIRLYKYYVCSKSVRNMFSVTLLTETISYF